MKVRLTLLGRDVLQLTIGGDSDTSPPATPLSVDGTYQEAPDTDVHLGFQTPGGYIPEDRR